MIAAETMTNDRELILRARSGERAAFGELVQRYMRRAYYAALGLVGSHEDALDLSQEAFARAYRARERIDPDRQFYTWLYQILRRLCFNHVRDRRVRRERLESAGFLLRIDPEVAPQMMHYATISRGEIEQLQSVKNVLRRGHVERVASDRLMMTNGDTITADSNTLYIDCTATAVQFVGSKTVPVFSGNHITLQAIRAPLVATSAAMTAYIEAHFDDESEKNQLISASRGTQPSRLFTKSGRRSRVASPR